ncbi:asparagine synthase (glutamine-hydrolysing) [Desulfobotulus alkaliphilus]|uniref:asparagine synthase (glutamine-hydrolyzing) n=2 Tax=Desulfobotulus alkaliphilus TaxID=622671 RepID=A0A562S6E1_9BACT|nr:asparagine synthase (glutamine-hydrolyzing) [Desulfobotulus alkaliphilus]TWI76907.1 asparagine synthase (glutamine-hydrolysing) [Desulfobotulus alkaliphilus]
MCGISGFLDFKKKSTHANLKKMTDTLVHRGPDDSGYFFETSPEAHIGLGHRRLSIIDLSSHGSQPMAFENLVMVYNGEIYNFKEIRKELENLNYTFTSSSDTEVALKAFHRWGIRAVDKFNGMFAMAIYDRIKSKLTLIRDRAGVKPLFWYHKNGLFLFGSELKSFHQHPSFEKHLNTDGLALYLQFGYIPQPHTIFCHTHKLRAGHFLEVDLGREHIREEKYWDVFDYYQKRKLKISEADAITETEKILKSACEYRMIADVPVGMFLSGGYDSSLVTALLQKDRTEKLKTFSIGFHEEKYNEAHYAREVATWLGTDHTEYYCTPKDALDIIPLLPEIYDEPFGDSSAIPTTLVSRIARQSVTVSLSADGGDEVFGGYEKYQQALKVNRILSFLPAKNVISASLIDIEPENLGFINKILRFDRRFRKVTQALESSHAGNIQALVSSVFTPKEIRQFLLAGSSSASTAFDDFILLDKQLSVLDRLLAIDYKSYQLDDILVKVDRATMSVSLEGREPLLDHRIIEYVARLDSCLKIKKGNKKYLLKEIVHRYLPKEMMDRPKKGFSVPVFYWFKNELRQFLLHYLDEQKIREAGIFNPLKVARLRDTYLAGSNLNINQIWLLLMFEMWREKWLK